MCDTDHLHRPPMLQTCCAPGCCHPMAPGCHPMAHGHAPQVRDVLRAGTDVDCTAFVGQHAQSALDQKLITLADIETRLAKLFRVRMRLQHFDPPGPLQARARARARTCTCTCTCTCTRHAHAHAHATHTPRTRACTRHAHAHAAGDPAFCGLLGLRQGSRARWRVARRHAAQEHQT